MILDPTRQPLAPSGDALRRHSKIRLVLALLVGAIAATASAMRVMPVPHWPLLGCIASYLSLSGAVHLVARRARRPPRTAIAVMLLGDLFLIFTTSAFLWRPQFHGRSLVLSFIVLHVAALSFGRAYAYLVAGAGMVGYTAVVVAAASDGAPLHVGEQVLSAVVFVAVAVLFTVQLGTLRDRAAKLVALFDSAEAGDFSREYDVDGDRAPDMITDMGRAYNRLQVALQSMVLTDPLTGCLNRRGFDQALGREIARSARAGSELALLAIDLDHFKHLNDRCGHLAGDSILRDLGALLRQSARAGDVVARTGGEEFTLVLPDTDAAGAFQVAMRLCERIRGREFAVGTRLIRITVSVGVAAADGTAVDRQGQELKLRADQALYAAKRLGRDRVLTWSA